MPKSSNTFRILITGCGAPGTSGTVHMLLKGAASERVSLSLFGTDTRANPPLISGLVSVHRVFSPNDSRYISSINELIDRFEINLVIPQTTAESEVLSRSTHLVHAPVAVLPHEKFVLLNDKLRLAKAVKNANLPSPKFFEAQNLRDLETFAHELGYPERDFVVKIPTSSGMRGVRRVTHENESLNVFLNEKPSGWSITFEDLMSVFRGNEFPRMMVMEFLPGEEFSVDVLVRNGHRAIITRTRNIMRAGISMDANLVENNVVHDFVSSLIEHLEIEGLLGFQFISQGSNINILECNPRVQGSMVASLLGGVNLLWIEVKWHLGLDIDAKEFEVINHSGHFRRVWGGALTYQDGQVERF